MLSNFTSQLEGFWLNPNYGLSVHFFHLQGFSPGNPVSSHFLKKTHVRLTGAKLPGGAGVTMHGCSSICVKAMDWQPVQSIALLLPEE